MCKQASLINLIFQPCMRKFLFRGVKITFYDCEGLHAPRLRICKVVDWIARSPWNYARKWKIRVLWHLSVTNMGYEELVPCVSFYKHLNIRRKDNLILLFMKLLLKLLKVLNSYQIISAIKSCNNYTHVCIANTGTCIKLISFTKIENKKHLQINVFQPKSFVFLFKFADEMNI